MVAGDLRDRVTIQEATLVTDTQGGRTTTWGTLDTVWASVQPARADEALQARGIGSVGVYRVTMRYRADVSPSMRLAWTPYQAATAKTLEIHGVQPLATDRAFLVVDCAERI